MASHPTDLVPAYFTPVGHQCTSGYVSLLFAVEITHFLLYSKSCLWPPESPSKCSCQGPWGLFLKLYDLVPLVGRLTVGTGAASNSFFSFFFFFEL